MLRVNKLTDYGSVILSHMARNPNQRFSATSLAREVDLPTTTVKKLLKMLSKNALVTAHRGKNGGYCLARPAQQISLVDIVSAIEGPVALTECCVKAGICRIEEQCNIRDNWQNINRIIHNRLAQVTLAEMVR